MDDSAKCKIFLRYIFFLLYTNKLNLFAIETTLTRMIEDKKEQLYNKKSSYKTHVATATSFIKKKIINPGLSD